MASTPVQRPKDKGKHRPIEEEKNRCSVQAVVALQILHLLAGLKYDLRVWLAIPRGDSQTAQGWKLITPPTDSPIPNEADQDLAVRRALAAEWRFWRVDWRAVLVNMATVANTLRPNGEVLKTYDGNRSNRQKRSSHPVTFPSKASAARSATSGLGPFTVQRRTPRAEDVQIEILYCGVCHSDVHHVRDEWNAIMPTVYPCVLRDEIVGRVARVGSAVKKFKEGDIAAVGCMVNSCRKCRSCLAGGEQHCENRMTLTYLGEDKILGGVTYGGYSDSIVVDEAALHNHHVFEE